MPCPGCGGAGAAEAAFCIPAPQKLPDKVAVDLEAFFNQEVLCGRPLTLTLEARGRNVGR